MATKTNFCFSKFYDLEITKGKYSIKLKDDWIAVTVPDGRNPYVYLRNWLKEELKKILERHLSKYSALMNVNFNRFYIKAHKSKWGAVQQKEISTLT